MDEIIAELAIRTGEDGEGLFTSRDVFDAKQAKGEGVTFGAVQRRMSVAADEGKIEFVRMVRRQNRTGVVYYAPGYRRAQNKEG